MNNVKVGIIGAGFMGAAHLENLRRIPGVEITAIADINMSAAQKLAEKFSIAHVYETWQELIADPEIHSVHNCTPNTLHYEINKAAILAGKAILSEKPLTNTAAQSEELVRLAEEKNVLNAVNFSYRNYPLPRYARQLVSNGNLGKIFLVHGHYLQDWLIYPEDYNWRVDVKHGGASRAVADIGSHWCDLVQFITGQKITAVFADLETVHKTRFKPDAEVETFKGKEQSQLKGLREVPVETEDVGMVLFRLESGAKGVFTVSQVSAGHKNCFKIEIDGSRMSLQWDQEEPNQLKMGFRNKANEILVKDSSLLEGESTDFIHYPGGHPEGYPDAFKNLFLNFYATLIKKTPVNFPTFADGLLENRIVEAILKSSSQKMWVNVD
jgi:predicted dehydrogenase